MTATDQLSALQGHHTPPVPTAGRATRLWAGDVVTVNPDGTVDVQPIASRATKTKVTVPVGVNPTVGDRVLVTDLLGDPRQPIVVTSITAASQAAVTNLRGKPVAAVSNPALYQGLVWNGSAWAPANLVNSFNGRVGPVTPQSGDYTAAQVGALAAANNLSDLGSPATALTNMGALALAAGPGHTGAVDYGTGSVSFSASATSTTITISHNLGRVPQIIVSGNSGDYPAKSISVGFASLTSANFQATATTSSAAFSGGFSFYWLAIG